MSETQSTAPAASEPGKRVPEGRRVIFLLDAASALEERMLRRWVEARCGESAPAEVVRLDASRRVRPGDGEVLETALATDDDPLLLPLRVAWLAPQRDGRRAARLSHLLLLGDPRDPGSLRARWIARLKPDRCRIVEAEAAPASELRQRWRAALGQDVAETVGLAQFVARQAALALERGERKLRGARYKVPRLLREDILERSAFQGGIARLARELGREPRALAREASRALREIAASHSPLMIDVFAQILGSSMRGYESLRVDQAQVEEIRLLAQRHPLVFLPTHKSNLDHGVLRRVLHENGLPPNHTAGGDNMKFFPMGSIARRAGIFFIRRSFKEDAVYKFVLRSYIDFLIEKRFPLEWYVEGGRSRSGKLLPPRYGLLAYVVDAYRRGKSEDVMLIPVSIAYDQISEVGEYAAEQRGVPKEREGLGWLIRFQRRLGRQYGNIDLRFGEPLSLRKTIGEPPQSGQVDATEPDLTVQKIAFEVCARINRVTPITPISLAMLALLRTDSAMSVSELRNALVPLVEYVERRGLPTTEKLVFDTPKDLERLLDPLVANGVLARFDGGRDVVYSIDGNQPIAAAYYRNTIIHFLINGAIAELALLSAAESEDCRGAFWAEVNRLRDVLKFEFFFAEKDVYLGEIRRELALHALDWESQLDRPSEVRALLQQIRPFLAHRVLRPFLEAYWVVADHLASLSHAQAADETELLRACLAWGQQYVLQRRIQSREAVSRSLLQTGLRLAGHRGLLDAASPTLAEERRQFADELRETLGRVDAIDALGAARRAGALA
ncbi:MAG: glycerol-3-phosphate 1-O-acyltransferase [Deltaproteobacteria bacterium]|nr:glycerol-3-phosphate 1-O-acyltransferase [Deltaproteobacteria bacterium]